MVTDTELQLDGDGITKYGMIRLIVLGLLVLTQCSLMLVNFGAATNITNKLALI